MVVFLCAVVVDEQNAHTEEQELQSPNDFRKDSEDENKDNEKDEDTKELESLPCEFTLLNLRHAVAVIRFLWDTKCSCLPALKAKSSIGLHVNVMEPLKSVREKAILSKEWNDVLCTHSIHIFCMLGIPRWFIIVAKMPIIQE